MNQCLRCNNSCVGKAVFCNDCQIWLLNRSQQKEQDFAEPGVCPPTVVVQVVEQARTDPVAETLYPVPVQPGSASQQRETPASIPTTGNLTTSLQIARDRHRHRILRMRRIFIWLSILAVVALAMDGVLIACVTFTHLTHNQPGSTGMPMLTLSQTIVFRGQIVALHLDHCQPLAHIFLSHDIQEPLQIDAPSALIQVNTSGNADVHVRVDASWKLGMHRIQAEDVHTHAVFSANLQVIGAGPIQPPHLQISQMTLDLGIALQGENTVQSLAMNNTGGGTIAWVASSDQPWLKFTPVQGIFSDSQTISIAVSRANLQAGKYKGTITIDSNTGIPSVIQVMMTVLPLPVDAGAVLVVAPPVLSFTTTDGGLDTAEQVVTVSNPGSRPLSWSLSSSAPTDSVNQSGSFQDNVHWLSAQPSSGVIVPHAATAVHVLVNSHMLLANMYSGSLMFMAGQSALNNQQPVAVSLNVQQHCGVETSVDSLSFRTTIGQHRAVSQLLGLSSTSGCSDTVPWQAFSLADWLNITPASGQLQAKADVATMVEANGSQLGAGTYSGFIVFLTELRIKTIAVRLTVLSSPSSTSPQVLPASTNSDGSTPAPSATASGSGIPATAGPFEAPVLNIAPLNLSFSVIQGGGNPPSQTVALADTGGGSFYWQATSSSNVSWMNIAAGSAIVSPGQSGQLSINVNVANLAAGTYRAQVSIIATDSAGMAVAGSPQTLVVTLIVQPPCSVQVAPTNLAFSASPLQFNPPPGQSITIKSVGGCTRPITWNAQVDSGSRGWMTLSSTSGLDTGQGSTITVNVVTRDVLFNSQGQITITAIDAAGVAVPNSPRTVVVTLTVL